MAVKVLYVDIRDDNQVMKASDVAWETEMTAENAVQRALGETLASEIAHDLISDNSGLIVAWHDVKIEQHSEVGGVADLNWLIPDKSTLTIVYENLKTPQKQIDLSSEWMLSIELEKQAEIGAGVEALTRDIWDEIRRIDWAKYKFSDEHSPDLLRLIQELVAEDKTIRWNASAGISDLLQLAVERQLNDLPFDIAPILIQLLASPETPQKSLVSGLLIDLIGYSDVVDLKSLEEEAIRLKRAVCSGSGLYKQLMEATVDSNLREDLTYLLEQCST